jgi:D-alanyl-D-alanine carboxypeptidase/D-alanyl-D-alanine-endopeptidase (penicillin-binding protein 4)
MKKGCEKVLRLQNIFLIIIGIFLLNVDYNSNQVFAYVNQITLNEKINQILRNEKDLKGAIAGVSIRSGSSGQLIYEHLGDIRMRPASNLKLLTAACALSVLGKNYTFSTEIIANGRLKKGILAGNLYIKGKGDPTLVKSDFDKMAEKLQKMGIKKISGDFIGDDSWFDQTRFPLDLPWSDETAYYGAPISALTASPTADFDAGTVVINIIPGEKVGTKPYVKVNPETNAVHIINKAETVSTDEKKNLKILRQHDKKTIIVQGTIPVNDKAVKEWISVKDPTKFAMDLFNQSLINHGIKVKGKIKTGKAPDNRKPLLIHDSIPLSQLMLPFMKLSNNGHAEILIKAMGREKEGEGSWEKGISVLKSSLIKFGLNPQIMVLRDGSGVSHVDLVPANQITQLLFNIQKENWFPAYLHSLPLAGEKNKAIGGTLRNRLNDPALRGRIRAKTGSISTVSSLSGYVDTNSGQTLIFSILLNNLLDEDCGKKIEDKIVMLLANQ